MKRPFIRKDCREAFVGVAFVGVAFVGVAFVGVAFLKKGPPPHPLSKTSDEEY